MTDMKRTEFDTAVQVLRDAAAAYYDTDTVLMADADYDTLLDSVAAAAAAHPDWETFGLLDQVAAGTSTGGDIAHPTPMLSLAKATEPGEITAFLARLGGAPTATEVKLDGMAVRAVYSAGVLTLVATRGDGTTGEDVTASARTVAGLPAALSQPYDLEVRGEVYMSDSDFVTASANRVAAGKAAFVNPRNATAGTLRNADLTYTAPLSFAAYDASGPFLDDLDTHTARMAALPDLGIITAASLLPDVDETAEPDALIAEIGRRRETLGFPIDGAVIKADRDSDRARLGSSSRTPSWAIAFKYPAAEGRSILRGIDVAVGRTGRISYTAVIDPVFVAGATVSRASLHNADWITAQGLGIGSAVAVVRAGDVIPRVTALLGEQDGDVTPYVPATDCPQCGEPLDTSSLLWRCHTPSCSVVGRITYAASRDVWDIDGLGEEVATALVEAGLVSDIADLFELDVAQVAEVVIGRTATGAERRIGEATATRIVAGIDQARKAPLARTITALGIRMTGRSVGRWLAAEFGSMQALRAASVSQVAAIEKLGEIKATHIVNGLAAMGSVIDRLAAAGLPMQVESHGGQAPLAGLTVVVTGAMTGPLAGVSRNEMNELIDAAGGKSSGSVSARTSLLVCGEPGSSKYLKAVELGVRIVTPEEFAVMLDR